VLQDGDSIVDPGDQDISETTIWEFVVDKAGA
jgi:hypothetical protein